MNAAAPSVGRARHLYVLAAVRGTFDTLRLRTENSSAARLYEQMGAYHGATLIHAED